MYHMFCCVTHFVVRFQVANPFYTYTYYIKMMEYILNKIFICKLLYAQQHSVTSQRSEYSGTQLTDPQMSQNRQLSALPKRFLENGFVWDLLEREDINIYLNVVNRIIFFRD